MAETSDVEEIVNHAAEGLAHAKIGEPEAKNGSSHAAADSNGETASDNHHDEDTPSEDLDEGIVEQLHQNGKKADFGKVFWVFQVLGFSCYVGNILFNHHDLTRNL